MQSEQIEATGLHAAVSTAVKRSGLKLYFLAARIPCHPNRLGAALAGREPITAEFAAKIFAALDNDGPEAA